MKQEKHDTIRWLLRFARSCRGKLTASVLLAALGCASGMIPYLAVSRILILVCGGEYGLGAVAGCWAIWGMCGCPLRPRC